MSKEAEIGMHTLKELNLDYVAMECVRDVGAEHCIGYLDEITPVKATERAVDRFLADHDHFENIEGRLFNYRLAGQDYTVNFLITSNEVRIIVKEAV